MIFLLSACSLFQTEPKIVINVTDVWGNPLVVQVRVDGLSRQSNPKGEVIFGEKELYSKEVSSRNFSIEAKGYMNQVMTHVHPVSAGESSRLRVKLYPNVQEKGLYQVAQGQYKPIHTTAATEKSSDLDVYVGFESKGETMLREGEELLFYGSDLAEFELHNLRPLDVQSIKKGSSVMEYDFKLDVVGALVSFRSIPLSQKNVYRIPMNKIISDGHYALVRKRDLQPQNIANANVYTFQKVSAK